MHLLKEVAENRHFPNSLFTYARQVNNIGKLREWLRKLISRRGTFFRFFFQLDPELNKFEI